VNRYLPGSCQDRGRGAVGRCHERKRGMMYSTWSVALIESGSDVGLRLLLRWPLALPGSSIAASVSYSPLRLTLGPELQ
jgi:hypothetical protein